MIFTDNEASSIWCPAAGTPQHADPIRKGAHGCLLKRCAYYRQVDAGRGYCGGGGLPSVQVAPDPIVSAPDTRIDRVTRPAHPPKNRNR
jgi:hypothetical protein